MKNTPSTGCRSSAAPVLPSPTTGMNTSSGHAGRVQHVGDVHAGQRRELGRLVEHGVAGGERRHEHVAADEVRIVPRRDVGDHAERLVARCAPRACPAASANTSRRAARARVSREEEVDAAGEAVQLVARLADRLADLERQRARELGLAVDERSRGTCGSPRAASSSASRPTPAARRARARTSRARPSRCRRRRRQHGAGRGIQDLHRAFGMDRGARERRPRCRLERVRGGLVARRGREEIVEQRRVVDERRVAGRMELRVPLHAEQVRRTASSGSPRRCGPAPTTPRRPGRGPGPSPPGGGPSWSSPA